MKLKRRCLTLFHREALAFFLYISFLLLDSALAQQFLASGRERLALLELRSSLGLRAKEWPIKSDPCVSWVGVQCTNGRVTEINISGFPRTKKGSRSPRFSVDSLQNLTALASFNASHFSLPGSIPDWLGLQVNALQVLDLRSCSVSGALQSSLGSFRQLNELRLSDNDLTGVVPSSLGRLSTLSVLDLSCNSLTGSIPAAFGGLRDLTFLDLSENFLSGTIPLEITNLDKLRLLNLSGNSLSSSIPPKLGDLLNLVNLDLGFNAFSGSLPPDLRRLRSLQRMAIGNNFLSGSLPRNLFPSLTQLRLLVLSHNDFDGDFPDELWSLPSLQLLDVSENNFTGVLPSDVSLRSNTTSAALLNVSNNLFYGNITPVVRRFSVIDLSRNYFEGPVPDFACGNSNLVENCLRSSPNQRTSEDCASFYADRTPTKSLPPIPRKKGHKLPIILVSVFAALGLVILAAIIILLVIICKLKNCNNNRRSIVAEPVVPTAGGCASPTPLGDLSMLGDPFTYQQIIDATNEFNEANLIKIGHSGELYRGIIEGGVPVVVKKIDFNSIVRKESYVSELEFLSKACSNPRIVPLLGHCLEKENERFLVYKLIPNGDLRSSLFKKVDSDDALQSLDWIMRLKIAIGAAEGLSFLHHECNPPLVHRDVQASSILLDDKFEVRLGSLSEVCAQEGDEPRRHNRIARLFRSPQNSDQGSSGTPNAATRSHDVYCFGKVLLELVTGKLGMSSPEDPNAKEYLDTTLPCISIYEKDLITNVVDPTLILDEDLLEEAWAMAVIAKSCLNPKPNRRPLMRHVLRALENPLKVVRESSSRRSWNSANLFGSWRRSTSSDVAAVGQSQSQKIEVATGSFKRSDSQGSGGQRSSSMRRPSKEIFPEPLDEG